MPKQPTIINVSAEGPRGPQGIPGPPGPNAVQSVNGHVGVVVLAPADVGADVAGAAAAAAGASIPLTQRGTAEGVATLDVGGHIPIAQLPRTAMGTGLYTFGEGDRTNIFTPDPGALMAEFKRGTAAAPDETYGPQLRLSRTISIAEATFAGDGAPGLASIYAVTRALSTSQGQAIGIYGGAITDGTNVGAHSSADAVGGYFVGRASSTAGNSRAGIGIFANGRRESTESATTGAEIVSDNETLVNGKYVESGASSTKGIWLHASGTAGSGCGLQLGFTGRSFEVGIGFNVGSASAASIRDDSQSQFSIRIRGTHAGCGISVKQGSGVVLLGSATEFAIEAGAILETPSLRINSTGLHLGGGTPIAKPNVNKGASADELNTALKNIGAIGGS